MAEAPETCAVWPESLADGQLTVNLERKAVIQKIKLVIVGVMLFKLSLVRLCMKIATETIFTKETLLNRRHQHIISSFSNQSKTFI